MSTIKKEHKVLKITDTLYSISKFLNYEDKSNLLSSSKTIFNKIRYPNFIIIPPSGHCKYNQWFFDI